MIHQPIFTNVMVLITTINLLGCTGESTLFQLNKSDTPTTSSEMNFITLDACQDQPLIHNLDSINGSSITFSTVPDSGAKNDAGSKGGCNQQLTANIKLPGADVEVLFKQMRIGIPKENKATKRIMNIGTF